jgi:molybdopterin-guanine dinucleotide biosynthesis protein A
VQDIFPGKGPLAGIHAVLKNANAPVFCCACDMPHLNADFIRYLCESLGDYDAVIPRAGRFLEPLHAIYTPACLPVIEEELQGKAGPMEQVFARLRVLYVGEDKAKQFDDSLRMFDNWNTPQDVEKQGKT